MGETSKTPLGFWIISGLSLLWNAFGAFDYTMTQTKNAEYLAAFTPEQRTYFESFPTWMEAAWALGIWGALAGSALLLLRNRHAVTACSSMRERKRLRGCYAEPRRRCNRKLHRR